MKQCFEFEFGKIARQYATLQEEVKLQREEAQRQSEYIINLEKIIAAQNNALRADEVFAA